MQISESERIILIQKKEEISKLTDEIFEITGKKDTSTQDVIDVKKKMVKILSLLNTIATYSYPNRDLDAMMKYVTKIFALQMQSNEQIVIPNGIEFFCTVANSTTFTYSWFPSLFKAQYKDIGVELQK